MYAGHFGIALAVRARDPSLPLAWLLVASVAPDLLVLSVFHTAPAIAVVATVAFIVGRLKFSTRSGLLLGALVVAHFVADLLTSALAIWPNGPEAGLRWYDRPLLDFIIEAGVIAVGWSLWRRSLPHDGHSRALRMLMLFVLAQAAFSVFIAGGAND